MVILEMGQLWNLDSQESKFMKIIPQQKVKWDEKNYSVFIFKILLAVVPYLIQKAFMMILL